MKLSGNFKEDFDLVCTTKNIDLLKELVFRVTIPPPKMPPSKPNDNDCDIIFNGDAYGPMLTYAEEDRLKSIFDIELLQSLGVV